MDEELKAKALEQFERLWNKLGEAALAAFTEYVDEECED